MILQKNFYSLKHGSNALVGSLVTKRNIVNVHRNKLIKEHEQIVEGDKVNELFKRLREENEKLDEKYQYATLVHSLNYSDQKNTISTYEDYYSLDNSGNLDEPMKEMIYSEKSIPKDRNGIPLHHTWDPKIIYTACREFSWRNFTPVDSKKFTHSHVSGKSVIFEDGVEMKMNSDEFVRRKLINFLTPREFEMVLDKKISSFKNGGRGAISKKGNKRYGDVKLTLAEIQDIKDIQENFQNEFKSEIDYYNNNHKKDPTLKKPQLDIEAISEKYNLPAKAIIKILNSTSVEKYRPEQLAKRLKKDKKLLERRAQLSENQE
ncbi:uncharacterized protein HGUI_02555 [Hanseniaspora guilliermondii]|uniref:Uncharacterized protein n=1 Tax=Hanseniaspora guilliermondii TaxID=56406 RepID=A0A1L0B5N7_9ASCO|nr:uncharacterized protein HGUI_02555 [Hanseniaspora guilliermondii]